jgi:SAM-dependent methyltransferase
METQGYKALAKYYDLVYGEKDYQAEASYLERLLEGSSLEREILDVGCGTGSHLAALEELGYTCEGLDLNEGMLAVAREKVTGKLYEGDMTDFDLQKKYGAVTCMYAAFNHLTEFDDARNAIGCFGRHLESGGRVIIDLHNKKRSGSRHDVLEGGVQRRMFWVYNPQTGIEVSDVRFCMPDGKWLQDWHTMRIYTPDQMKEILEANYFKDIHFYEGYKLVRNSPVAAKPNSKQLVVVGTKR